MQIHDLIGLLLEVVLLAATGVALVAVLVLFGSRFFDDSKDMDVIGSHLVASDGKSWDFSKENHSSKARAQRDVKPIDDSPDVWDGVEYSDDEKRFDLIPAQGEIRPVKSDMDLEIIDAEIIPE